MAKFCSLCWAQAERSGARLSPLAHSSPACEDWFALGRDKFERLQVRVELVIGTASISAVACLLCSSSAYSPSPYFAGFRPMAPRQQNHSRICRPATAPPLHLVALPPPQLVNANHGSSLSSKAKNHYQDTEADEARQDNSPAPANQLSPDPLALTCRETRKANPDPSLLFKRAKVPRTLGESAALHVEGGIPHFFSSPSNALSANTAVLAESRPRPPCCAYPSSTPPPVRTTPALQRVRSQSLADQRRYCTIASKKRRLPLWPYSSNTNTSFYWTLVTSLTCPHSAGRGRLLRW